MTNGEKIQQMFPRKCPHIGFNENFGRIWLMQDGEDFANFTLKWWNAEYKEPVIRDNGVKDELEPTTKNCESCRYYGSHHEMCNYCYKCSLCTEGEPTTKNDLEVDCVSRILVQSAISKSIEYKENPYQLYKRIERLPSVTPQPKIGHWIPTYGNVKCSVCGSVKDSREVGKATHYCDFCGAKMESEEV